jgi:hypothetical protein
MQFLAITSPGNPVLSRHALHRLAPLLLTVILVALGCGGDARKPAFPVKGQVLVGGKPAAKAQIIFHPLTDPDGKAPRPSGQVTADGSFTLNTYTAGDGAPAGEYAVTVTWPQGQSNIGGDSDAGPDRLGGRYANPKTTPLRAKVDAAPTDIPAYNLK